MSNRGINPPMFSLLAPNPALPLDMGNFPAPATVTGLSAAQMGSYTLKYNNMQAILALSNALPVPVTNWMHVGQPGWTLLANAAGSGTWRGMGDKVCRGRKAIIQLLGAHAQPTPVVNAAAPAPAAAAAAPVAVAAAPVVAAANPAPAPAAAAAADDDDDDDDDDEDYEEDEDEEDEDDDEEEDEEEEVEEDN